MSKSMWRERRAVGSGDKLEVFDEWELDADLLQEMRLLEEHVGKTLGQRVEKHEIVPWNGDFRTLTDEQLDNMLNSYAEVNGLSPEYIELMQLQVLGLDPSVRANAEAQLAPANTAPTPTQGHALPTHAP